MASAVGHSGRPKSSNIPAIVANSNHTSGAVKKAPTNPRNNSNRLGLHPDSNPAEKRQVVGQYMLGKTIGEGTFGKVKLAAHMPSGEKVAVKILEKNKIKDAADVRRVNREIKILKKARHGNIIQLYEVLDTQNAIYLIMECAEGGEMFDYIVAQKRVPEMQACIFFHQIVEGVDMLHKNEITHRDLKPENLLLKASPDGYIVKVVDFGLSNTHEGGKLLATACGSPCYAAPEMIAGRKYNGPLADIWSMGVILFALVSGFLPFEDPNTAALYKKILAGDYKPPKHISNEVKDLIKCILEVDPRKRYSMNDIRKHPWYTMVPESSIPKEAINVYIDEQTRAETLKVLATSGLDTQAVMDGLASHACNSITAMYYLFEQKHRAIRAKNPKKVLISEIPQNHSDLTASSQRSAPETHGVTAASQSQQQPGNRLVALPNNTKTTTTATAATTTAINGITTTPYMQAPPILQQQLRYQQQHQQQQQQQAASMNNPMPSLDTYMKNGLQPLPNQRLNGPTQKPLTDIPRLNLRDAAEESIIVSQTSRAVPVSQQVTGQVAGSQTARPALGIPVDDNNSITGIPVPMDSVAMYMMQEGLEAYARPSTRRSRARSRGAAVDENAGGLDIGPAIGSLDVEKQLQSLQISTEPVANNAAAAAAGGAAHISISPKQQSSPIRTGGVGAIPAGVSLAPVVPSAPDASQRASSAHGGRRGKNITNIPPPSQTGQVSDGDTGATATNARIEAVRNKANAQGSFNLNSVL